MQGEQNVYEIKGSQFPFGVFSLGDGSRKIFVRKRYLLRNPGEWEEVMGKVGTLKGISHRNTINLRSIEEKEGAVDLIYQYVPCSLEEAFADDPDLSLKDMHRQFIELAIYLAKHCILTRFAPSRCGLLPSDHRPTLKYYLPLPEIAITRDRAALQKSVQLFNIQAMHYLDTLASHPNTQPNHEVSSHRTFNNRAKLTDTRDSFLSRLNRKLSSPKHYLPGRKLSSLSKVLTEITEKQKKRGASTTISGDSYSTFKSILAPKLQHFDNAHFQALPRFDTTPHFDSNPHFDTPHFETSKLISSAEEVGGKGLGEVEGGEGLKRCVSEGEPFGVVLARSRRALGQLQNLRSMMSSYKGFIAAIIGLKKQE